MKSQPPGGVAPPASARKGAVGITTTVPIEILYAAGRAPVDLNNVFIAHPKAAHFALEAEKAGLPRTACGWNKGVLAAAILGGFKTVIEVVQGDCSTTEAVGKILKERRVSVIPFSYPMDASPSAMRCEMGALCRRFRTSEKRAEDVWRSLRPARDLLKEIDRLTWEEGRVSGFENHLWLVSGSDMNGSPDTFRSEADSFLQRASTRIPFREKTRVGYVGVPSMISDLYERVEELGGRVVFNELQRQFSMCEPAGSFVEQYTRYTYPYSIFQRVEDIRREVERRGLHCLIHYTQTFCFHSIEDQVLRRELKVPVLTIEADHPSGLAPRDGIRLENFLRSVRPVTRFRKTRLRTPARLGLDLGSRSVKLVVRQGGQTHYKEVFDTIGFYRRFRSTGADGPAVDADSVLQAVPAIHGVEKQKVEVRTTGYGRNLVRATRGDAVPELLAQTRGARLQTGLDDFTLLDIGGQDTKVVLVRGGRMADFAMNDRCAAGGGRYLENMANALGVTVDEMGMYSLDPVSLDITCATFGESEVVGKIAEGAPIESICAGVNRTVFLRVQPDLDRLPSKVLVVVGGVAHNAAILRFLAAETGFQSVVVPPDPVFNGAIGATEQGEEN